MNEFNKTNYKKYSFRFSLKNDQEIIEILESQPDKTGFIRNLILQSKQKK